MKTKVNVIYDSSLFFFTDYFLFPLAWIQVVYIVRSFDCLDDMTVHKIHAVEKIGNVVGRFFPD